MPAHHRVLKGTQVSYRRSRLEPKPLSVKHQLLPTSFCQIPRPNEKSVSNAPPVSITNFRTIGSYSWAAESRGLGTCTIAVPGSPAIWRPKMLPSQVELQCGPRYVDRNRYEVPAAPLLPLFRSVDAYASTSPHPPPFHWPSVDLVTDRKNLKLLLQWVAGSRTPFRIDAQLAGHKTLLLNRWDPRAKENEDADEPAYSYSIAKAVTRDMPGFDTHNRVVNYNIGGLNAVVRFDANAFDPTSTPPELLDALFNPHHTQPPPAQMGGDSCTINVVRAGMAIPHASLLSLKTFWARDATPDDDADAAAAATQARHHASCFFAQTPRLIKLPHVRGRVAGMEETLSLSPSEKSLKKMRVALLEMRERMLGLGETGRRCMVSWVFGRERVAEAYAAERPRSCLPQDVLARFEVP